MHILLYSLLAYPVINALYLSIILTFSAIWSVLAVIVCLIFVLVRPVTEMVNLQFPLSMWMLEKSIPSVVVRMLMIPLYPLNLVFSIRYLHNIFDFGEFKRGTKRMLYPMCFFMVFPCLMVIEEED